MHSATTRAAVSRVAATGFSRAPPHLVTTRWRSSSSAWLASSAERHRSTCQDAVMSADVRDCILAIDAGTTGVTELIVTAQGGIAARGYQEFAQHFPRPGWVEHAPEEIWQATLEATRSCLDAWGRDHSELRGIG